MLAGAAAYLLLGLVSGTPQNPPVSPPPPQPQPSVTFRRQIIIRSIRIRPVRPDPTTRVEWREGKGPRCLPARAIAGASQLGQNSVDLMLRNGTRIRARLGSTCPALDYYDGFYITPGSDGFVCADREVIRSRVGGECEIDRFRLLTPIEKP